jgi:hypothetical protein
VATPTVTSLVLPNVAHTFPIDVTGPAGCAWTATSPTSWLQISSGGSGTGNASVGITASRNISRFARSGTLSIAGRTIPVQQAGFIPAAAHDINGDGGSDLLWHHQSTGQIATWYLRGTTVVSTQPLDIPAVTNTNWKIVGTGDLDGDGYADLVWQDAFGYLATWALRGRAVLSTRFLSIHRVADPDWKIRGVGDLNGDGRADIVWQHDTLGTLAVWYMNGHIVLNTLVLSVPTMPDPNWQIAGAGDINGDGKADLIWQNQLTGGLGAWLMNGATVTYQSKLSINSNTDTTWKIRGVGDVNGDSIADLIWQNTVSGALAVWYLDRFNVIFQTKLQEIVADTNWKLAGPG